MKYLFIIIATFSYVSIVSAQSGSAENLAQIVCLSRTSGANASSLGQVFIFTQEPGTGVDGNTLVNPNSEEFMNTLVTPNVSFQMSHYIESPNFVDGFVRLNEPLSSQQEGLSQLVNELSEGSTDRGPEHLVLAQRQQNGFGIGRFSDNLGDRATFRFDDMNGSVKYNGSPEIVSCHASIISRTPQSLVLNEETFVEDYQSAAVAN